LSVSGTFFAWGQFVIVGLGVDIAGAVVLGLAFATKDPERMRDEVPSSVAAPTTPGHVSIAFPQALLESMIRQRAEARLGLLLLVGGFLMQAASGAAGSARLSGPEIGVAVVAVGFSWVLAVAAFKTYVPWEARRVTARVPERSLCSTPRGAPRRPAPAIDVSPNRQHAIAVQRVRH
jgi:hypothetical protein